MNPLIVISPIAYWSATASLVNAVGGYTIGNGVRLSADGQEPATHLGLHTPAGDEFMALATGRVVPETDEYTPEEIAGLLSQLTISPTWDGSEYAYPTDEYDVPLVKRALFDAVIADMGLQLVEVAI